MKRILAGLVLTVLVVGCAKSDPVIHRALCTGEEKARLIMEEDLSEEEVDRKCKTINPKVNKNTMTREARRRKNISDHTAIDPIFQEESLFW